MDDRLSKSEIRKDALQETAQSGASTVGEVTTIITTAVKDVSVRSAGWPPTCSRSATGPPRAGAHRRPSGVIDELSVQGVGHGWRLLRARSCGLTVR